MDNDTLDSIYKLYMSEVRRYLLYLCNDKYLAEDLLQETFFRAYLYLEDCPTNNVKAWLLKVGYNAFIDSQRKSKRSSPKEAEFFKEIPDNMNTEKHYEASEKLDLIKRLLNNMPEKQKKALQLCVFKDLSYKEAADLMAISLSQLKILIYRARQSLKENLEKEDLS